MSVTSQLPKANCMVVFLKSTYHLTVYGHKLTLMVLQKARLARIRIAKASSGAAFVNKKKAAEARIAAQESGIELDDSCREEDIFELQHHHLLRCLEKTTVIISMFVELKSTFP